MTSARFRTGVRTGALTSALIVLGAVPAGAVTQAPALSPGCTEGSGGRVTCTFTSPTTGEAQVVDVPDNVTSATMTLRGGAGGEGAFQFVLGPPTTSPGGAGGTAAATVTVDPDRDLEVRVGGAGQDGVDGGAGGAGGGGAGSVFGIPQVAAATGGGGGGGSEVRIQGTNPASDNPIIAAGGGGGGGSGSPLGLIPGPGPGGAGGGATGATAPSIDLGIGQIAGGGVGGNQTAGGAGGSLISFLPDLIVGEAGARGTGGDAPTGVLPGVIDGTGAGGGGGGFFGGGAGSIFSGGGGGSGFGPDGTTFGTGPDPAAAFSAAALPDGEVVIEFAAPEDDDQGGQGDGDDDGDTGAGGLDPCSDVTRLTVSDRLPLAPLSC